MVPEHYPLAAFVISDLWMSTRNEGAYTWDIVKKVLMGAGNNTPLIFLPVR